MFVIIVDGNKHICESAVIDSGIYFGCFIDKMCVIDQSNGCLSNVKYNLDLKTSKKLVKM